VMIGGTLKDWDGVIAQSEICYSIIWLVDQLLKF